MNKKIENNRLKKSKNKKFNRIKKH